MRRLKNKELPDDLQFYYEHEGIWKALQKGTSTIVVDTHSQHRDIWKKRGNRWYLQPKQEGGRVRPRLGPVPMRFQTVNIEDPPAEGDLSFTLQFDPDPPGLPKPTPDIMRAIDECKTQLTEDLGIPRRISFKEKDDHAGTPGDPELPEP